MSPTQHETFEAAARETAEQWRAQLPGLAVVLLVHVLVPAALIALVVSLFDFLLAVRGVVIDGGTLVFKWLVTCFVSASVLIVRHSRAELGGTSVDARVYLLFLAFATAMTVLWISPQTGAVAGNPGSKVGVALVNLGVVFAVWWLATALSRQMCLEDLGTTGRSRQGAVVHLGDGYREWLARSEWVEEPAAPERSRERAPEPPAASPLARLLLAPFRAVFGEVSLDAHGNPARGVARLVLLVLVACALAEPLLLRGEPEAGQAALRALLAFLLSAGLLLAVGSVAGLAHHAALAGGEMRLTTVASRAGAGAVFTVTVLSVALLLPGLRFVGTGELQAEARDGGGIAVDSSAEETGLSEPGSSRRAPTAPAGGGLPTLLATLGQLLIVPVVVLTLALVVWVLLRLKLDWGALLRGGCSGLLAALRNLLSRLSALRPGGGAEGRPRRLEPFVRLERLEVLPPEEAVLAAYGRWLELVELHGRPRPEGDTALDVLRSLPRSLQGVATTAGRLTLLYQRVAYGTLAATERDRADALAFLRELREALAPTEAA